MSLVSIITPVYNAEKYVSKCIDSVIGQTYSNWEHILVDDCSSDDSTRIINEFALKDNRVKLFRQDHNGGAGLARNRAIQESSGRFIAFLDCDDYWHHLKLEKQVNFMINNNYSFTYTDYYIIHKEEKQPKYRIKAPAKVNYNKMLDNDYIGCLTAIYDAKSLGKNYMPKIRKRQDWVLWLNILKKVDYAYCFQEPLAYYRVGDDSLSKNKFKLLKHNFNVYYRELKFTFLKSIIMMVNFLVHYFIYKAISKKKVKI